MSRIGKKPVILPKGVVLTVKEKEISVKGSLGEDKLTLLEGITVAVEGDNVNIVKVDSPDPKEDKRRAAYFGLSRTLISNMVVGVSTGFEKDLEIQGVGYRAAQQGKDIQFQLGFSHNIIFTAPEGIKLEVLEPTKVKVRGINKQAVGQVAANIRKLRGPEPYKGKGIRYKGEYVRKKAGKTGK